MKDIIGREIKVGDVVVYPNGLGVSAIDIVTKETPAGLRVGSNTYKCPGQCVLFTETYIQVRGQIAFDQMMLMNKDHMEYTYKEPKKKLQWIVKVYGAGVKAQGYRFRVVIQPIVDGTYTNDDNKVIPRARRSELTVIKCRDAGKGWRPGKLNGKLQLGDGYRVSSSETYLTTKLMLDSFGETPELPFVVGEYDDGEALKLMLDNIGITYEDNLK